MVYREVRRKPGLGVSESQQREVKPDTDVPLDDKRKEKPDRRTAGIFEACKNGFDGQPRTEMAVVANEIMYDIAQKLQNNEVTVREAIDRIIGWLTKELKKQQEMVVKDHLPKAPACEIKGLLASKNGELIFGGFKTSFLEVNQDNVAQIITELIDYLFKTYLNYEDETESDH